MDVWESKSGNDFIEMMEIAVNDLCAQQQRTNRLLEERNEIEKEKLKLLQKLLQEKETRKNDKDDLQDLFIN